MKKLLLTALIPLALFGNDEGGKIYNGYTYFSVGVQNTAYQEDFFSTTLGQNVHSDVKTTSPVYISGGLMRVNDKYDFSMDIASTLLPTQGDEKWYTDGALYQTNSFDAMINSMEFLGHYKVTNNHRFVLGATYTLDSYKRYTWKDETGAYITQTVTDPATGLPTDSGVKLGLTEERVATLYATTGYWYESIPHATMGNVRFKANALIGLPIWNQANNTSFEKITFNSTSGYKAEANLYAGYPLLKGLELGLFTGYNYQKKSGTDVAADGHTKWPENVLSSWQAGVSLVWNFSN
ncbi:MAG: hypothetical protein PHW18_02365 [Sulfuricurvum sp.]|uniref:hypothetical protein n=1 Tax=Sulfuricurvum sp. TaxID=2025608 RepID=UPI00262192C9|nr:hypothetical protein [Sulfuricurvum sp.]MDD2828399.1 hypothetical protein [Sulfuricurvum sp.]MDD4949404.1 hypothetical protein [Sulfuricurvum sp.]